MGDTTVQFIIISVGVVIAILPFIGDIRSFIGKQWEKVNMPDTTPDTPEIPDAPTTSGLAGIVSEWERFLNVLIANGMTECAEDMKTLLTKMTVEYRKDLNEDAPAPPAK